MSFITETFQPSPALQPFVAEYRYETFLGFNNESSPDQYCLPHGTTELIFQIKNPSCKGWQGSNFQQYPTAFLIGVTKETTVWTISGNTEIFHVRLKPEGFIQLFNRPLADFFNSFVDLEEILGWKGTHLLERLREAKTNIARIALIEAFFKQQLHFAAAENNYFLEALRRIRQAGGNLSIEYLSKSLQVGERQLQRTFKEKLGLSPKLYHRIVRFSQTYTDIQQQDHFNWADVALSHDYADQAHFIRDFKEFAGVTPGTMFTQMNYS
ncbi:MAG: DUF6597 domain-containing transcriptional factor [Saprospiraceae bacterium]